VSDSRLGRCTSPFHWPDVPPTLYKDTEDWKAVTRRVFLGDSGEATAFHVRYFEVAPGGFTTLERHEHAHCVVVLRGRGQVLLDCSLLELGLGDVLYVAPQDSHQLRNDQGVEPFGFLCVVDAHRDRPTPTRCDDP